MDREIHELSSSNGFTFHFCCINQFNDALFQPMDYRNDEVGDGSDSEEINGEEEIRGFNQLNQTRECDSCYELIIMKW